MIVTQKYFVNSWKEKPIAMIIKTKTFWKIIDKITNVWYNIITRKILVYYITSQENK